jgi:tRNA-2-methylthio-N6-dimethylallyladenosine synthase
VGRYRQLKKDNPLLRIGVGGCVAQQEKKKLIDDNPLIDFVFGTDNIDQLPELAEKARGTKDKLVNARFEYTKPYQIETLIRNPGISTFVNITKGCDNFCTFCVVPYTRGREKSRPFAHILDDVNKLTARGVKEVTLLGQNVNSYESECGVDFADLIERLALETDLQRIRYTTSHPKDFNQKLVDVMYRHQPKVCEYIHLPFQAGNSRVLEMMNRGYTREQYLEKIAMIKKAIPNVVLSTDIIVGFPTETDDEFKETIQMVEEVGFETIYAFKYSPRPFTKAARFEGQIAEDIKEDRLARLFAAHDALAKPMAESYVGKVLDVLVEGLDEKRGNMHGRTSQNKNVYFTGDKSLIGKMVQMRITKANPAVFRGELA